MAKAERTRSVFITIAERVLRYSSGSAMSPAEIWRCAEEWGIIPEEIKGKTPVQTLKSKLSVDIRQRGTESLFARASSGRYVLRADIPPEKVYDAPPLALPGSDEEPTVVLPTGFAASVLRFEGIKKFQPSQWSKLLDANTVNVLPRKEAENRFDYRQLVAYVVVQRGNEILEYTRGNYNRAEDHLKGSRCVGFGGHVSASDISLFSNDDAGVRAAAARELCEELRPQTGKFDLFQISSALEFVAVINDNSSATGRRHLGIVLRLEVGEDTAWDTVKKGEKGIRGLLWRSIEADSADLANYEYWSQLVIREMFGSRGGASTGFRLLHPAQLVRPHVVAVVGPIGSGKSLAVSELIEHYGYEQVNSGVVVAEVMGIPPVPLTPRQEFQDLASSFISSDSGPYLLASAISSRMLEAKSNYVVDGIRQRSTLAALRRQLDPRRLAVVYILTSPDKAYYFYRRREKPDCSPLEFFSLRDNPVEAETEDLLGDADAVLYNWAGSEHYRAMVRGLFR